MSLSYWFYKSRWALLFVSLAFYLLAVFEIVFPEMPGGFGIRSKFWGDEYVFSAYGPYGLAAIRVGWGSVALLMFIYSSKRFEGGTGPN